MPSARRWSEIREVGFFSGMRLLFYTYRLGGFLAYRIALQPVLLYYFLRNRLAREASREYLCRLREYCGDGDLPRPGLWNTYRHFHAFAVSSMDRLAVWANSSILQHIDFPDHPLLLRQLDTGKGAILLGAHLGNMEICRGLAINNPRLRLNILVHTRHANMFNRLLREVVGETAITLIEVSELSPATAIRLQGCIDRGEFIAVMADRVPSGGNARCTRVPFLGRPANFPDGPFILAALLKCPVYTMFCTRESSGYVVRSEKFAEMVTLPRTARSRALDGYARKYAAILEASVRRNPLQWFNFYPFWDQE